MSAHSGKSFRSFLAIQLSKPHPSDTVLIIIDAQNEYDHGKLAIADVKSSRAVIADIMRKWRNAKGDIVHVMHDTPDGAPLFTPGTELAREFEEFGVEQGEAEIHKPHPSAFTSTQLDSHLKKLGKSKILLVGYMAHVCISSTSRAGTELGYDVSVCRDGIGDRDIPGASAKQLVETVLAELGDFSATIVDSKDL
ncbi:MAG: hypothetical protein Q9217_004977 [Psora testacea]